MAGDKIWQIAANSDDVWACDMTLDEVRELIGAEGSTENLDSALDNAQGEISMQKRKETYVLIRIT